MTHASFRGLSFDSPAFPASYLVKGVSRDYRLRGAISWRVGNRYSCFKGQAVQTRVQHYKRLTRPCQPRAKAFFNLSCGSRKPIGLPSPCPENFLTARQLTGEGYITDCPCSVKRPAGNSRNNSFSLHAVEFLASFHRMAVSCVLTPAGLDS